MIAFGFLTITPIYFISRVSMPSATNHTAGILPAIRLALPIRPICFCSSAFVCGFHVNFIQTHLPAYIVDSGLAVLLAAGRGADRAVQYCRVFPVRLVGRCCRKKCACRHLWRAGSCF